MILRLTRTPLALSFVNVRTSVSRCCAEFTVTRDYYDDGVEPTTYITCEMCAVRLSGGYPYRST